MDNRWDNSLVDVIVEYLPEATAAALFFYFLYLWDNRTKNRDKEWFKLTRDIQSGNKDCVDKLIGLSYGLVDMSTRLAAFDRNEESDVMVTERGQDSGNID